MIGPTDPARRSLSPDLARGVMLLLIALAHAPAYLFGREIGPGGYPSSAIAVDRVVAFLQVDLVTGRAYPLFAALFGYGLVRLVARHADAGADAAVARRLIRRRGWWLIVFGLVHALLLWSGDILGAYGMIAVLLAGVLLRARGRTVAAIVAGCVAVVAVGGAAEAVSTPGGQTSPLPSTGETDPLGAAVLRLAEWTPSLFLQPVGLAGAVLLGIWAARRRVLDEPDQHPRTLRRIAALGLALAALGGLPMALIVASVWSSPSENTLLIAGGLHYATGYGGVGYAALLALVARRSDGRPGALVNALAACGQRSLTCYLTQSVVFVAVLASYGGGLGARVGLTAVTVVAILTWALTVAVASVMHRRMYRGPAEIVLRRLTYSAIITR